MKIAIINARNDDGQFPPLGIFYLGAVLREAGFPVSLQDPFPGDGSYLEKLRSFNPDLIGIGFMTAQYPRAREIFGVLKKEFPRAVFVAGGIHPTALPERTLEEFGFDYVVIGEGERVLLDLCRALGSGSGADKVPGLCLRGAAGAPVRTPPACPIEKLDELPLPGRDMADFGYYMSPPGPVRGLFSRRLGALMSSRGCPHRCIFCGSSEVMFGKRVRRLSVPRVLGELESLYRDYGIDSFYFLDDTFTANPAWVMEFCAGLTELSRRLGVKPVWACQARVDTVSEELMLAMKRAGCRQVELGIESGSDKVLKALGKNTTVAKILPAIETVKRAGMRTVATFMLGNPEETREDARLTFELAKKLDCSFTRFFFTTPFPGTKLYDMALERGWIKGVDFNSTWDILRAKEPVMEINIPRAELVAMLREMQNAFFFKNALSYATNFSLAWSLLVTMAANPLAALREIAGFAGSGNLEQFLLNILNLYRKRIVSGGARRSS